MTQMPCRVLGSSGIKVSEISLGTMMFGASTDEREAQSIVDHAADNGVNFIDTADVYAGGRSGHPEFAASAIRADPALLRGAAAVG